MLKSAINFHGSKPHYHLLDGLRGIAAICILIFHFLEYIFSDFKENPLGHGYLAVDFFFALSGFVIGYAYDHRIKTIGLKIFFRNRIIRLQPMVIWGAVVGLLGYTLTPFANNIATAGWSNIIISFIATMLLIPMPVLPNTVDNVFPLNAPTWSLSTEYLANIFYAFVLSRVSKKVLLLLCFMAAGWLIYIAKQRQWLIMGWSKEYYFDGWARTAFSFTAGLVIFRFNLIIKNKINALLLLLLLAAVFFIPHADNDWIRELLIVMIAFPCIISLSAGTSAEGFTKKLCIFLGRISYPLYMTHYFAITLFGSYYMLHKPSGAALWLPVVVLAVSLFIFAYLVMRFYDEPVRGYLVKKWGDKRLNK
ncbi:MAG: acyltransferase [Chitinophagaceae bacterium]|nr:acyltransferase [Chitinophagaceae bacterium]